MNTCPRFLIVFYQQHSLTMCSLTFLPRDTKYNREENADFAEHSIFVEGKWLEVQVMPFSLDSLCSELHLNYQWESSELYTFCGSLCQTHEPWCDFLQLLQFFQLDLFSLSLWQLSVLSHIDLCLPWNKEGSSSAVWTPAMNMWGGRGDRLHRG